MKNLGRTLLKLNLWIGWAAFFLSYGILNKLKIDNALYYGLISLFGTIAVYTFQRYIKSIDKKIPNGHLEWYRQHKNYVYSCIIISIALTGYFLLNILQWRIVTFLLLGILGLIAILYVVGLISSPLREIPYIKIHLVALVWIGVSFVFPFLNENHWITNDYLLVMSHYCYLFSIILPFDYRDRNIDPERIKTIPQVIGKNGSFLLSVLSFFLFILLSYYFDDGFDLLIMTALTIYHLSIMYLFYSDKYHDLSSFLLDGGIILLGTYYLFQIN